MTEPINNGGPAFPVECQFDSDGKLISGIQTGNRTGWLEGMTLRDYFAVRAMAAIITMPDGSDDGYYDEHSVAKNAYLMADAMIAAREKQS